MKRRLLTALLAVFLILLCMSVVPASAQTSDGNRLIDDAHLLTEEEKAEVSALLDEISTEKQADIVVVTTNSLYGRSPMQFADDFYDYGGYGFGEEYDGILFLVSMEDRDYWFSPCGLGITAVSDGEGIPYLTEKVVPYLSDGEYAKAFKKYAKSVGTMFEMAHDGKPYNGGRLKGDYFDGTLLLIAVFVGLLASIITICVLRGQLKSVKWQNTAHFYIQNGSMRLTGQNDIFLYRTVNRVRRASESSGGRSGGGGGGSHRSSSGRSHGGGGGKF